jgi:hypothetical protein
MTDDLKAKYADKIAKLLAKAESTTPEEAEMLTAKAQELMAQYAIDEAMIEAARGFSGESSKYGEEEFVAIGIYRYSLSKLTHVVLQANGLRTFEWTGKNPRVVDGKLYKETVVVVGCGQKGDLDRVRVLNTSLMLQAITAENAWWREHKHEHEWKPKKGHYERRQFLLSFAYGVHQKMTAAAERGKKAAEAEHSSDSVALVLRDKALVVQAEFEKRHPDLRSKRDSKKGGSMAAHAAGHAAGLRANTGEPSVGGERGALNR